MCGLVGIFSVDETPRVFPDVLMAMTRRLAHRGPDDSGYVFLGPGVGRAHPFTDKGAPPSVPAVVGLGHRRLSILDLSPLGHQPQSDSTGRVWMVYNGEVYNFVELRAELKALGHHFVSTSDTEVVLASYMEWGTECFRRFNGMWALALYDRRSRNLILSRDRFGEKPLYLTRIPGALLFASEIKALLVHPEVHPKANFRKIAAYAGWHYRYVDGEPASFFEGIDQIPPASFMTVGEDGQQSTTTYWRLPLGRRRHQSDESLIEEYRFLFEDAVRLRLRSDVPVGVMLSGGLDSTAIAAFAARNSASVRSFSGVTGEGAFDESDYIQETVNYTGIKSTVVRPEPTSLLDTLKEMMSYHDEPVCTVTWYSLYLLTRRMASEGIRVVLTGHGGDELLAGYWDHFHYFFHDLRRRGLSDADEVGAWRSLHRRDPAELERERQRIDALIQTRAGEPDRFAMGRAALSPALRALEGPRVPYVGAEDELSRRLALELFYETVPASLRAEDRNMMAHSLENRVPFLDYRLVEFCFSIPDEFKIRGGLGKWIHRKALRGLLPERVLWRRDKTGHNVPLDLWLRTSLRGTLSEMIGDDHPVNGAYYNPAALRGLFDRHQAGENHAMFFWQYLNLRLWVDQFGFSALTLEENTR